MGTNKKKINRKKLTDAELSTEITKLLNGGETGKTEIYGTIRIKFSIARDRYSRGYDKTYLEWGRIKQLADAKVTTDKAVKSAEMGVKSKTDKQLHLQKMIEGIQADIDKGILEEYVVVKGVLQVVTKIMNAEMRAVLRRTMKDLYAELNKMAGHYEPNKIEVKTSVIELFKFGYDDDDEDTEGED